MVDPMMPQVVICHRSLLRDRGGDRPRACTEAGSRSTPAPGGWTGWPAWPPRASTWPQLDVTDDDSDGGLRRRVLAEQRPGSTSWSTTPATAPTDRSRTCRWRGPAPARGQPVRTGPADPAGAARACGRRGAARIVNVSSVGGRFGEPLGAWYHASKFAVEGFSDSLRLELPSSASRSSWSSPARSRPSGAIARYEQRREVLRRRRLQPPGDGDGDDVRDQAYRRRGRRLGHRRGDPRRGDGQRPRPGTPRRSPPRSLIAAATPARPTALLDAGYARAHRQPAGALTLCSSPGPRPKLPTDCVTYAG